MFKADRSVPEFETGRQWNCFYESSWQNTWEQGGYDTGWGPFFVGLGSLAENAPDDPSPYFPGLTNFQAALVAGSTPDPTAFCPWYHFVAPINAGDPPMPVDLRFTAVGAWFDFLQTASPFEPTRFVADYYAVICDEQDVPFDDHLEDITVPVFYVGAAGGFGEVGVYTLDLLGSTDRTVQIFSYYPPETGDFAHIDLLTATNALVAVFPEILSWVVSHTS
jgi:hypothetical protein